ncbi:hypothetical protein ACWOET_12220 [Enterococcus caccae]|nr:hypothetical protein RU98_GL002090 [Enterococcus caccae]
MKNWKATVSIVFLVVIVISVFYGTQSKGIDQSKSKKKQSDRIETKQSVEGEKEMLNKGKELSVEQELKSKYKDYLKVIEEKLSVPIEFVLKDVTENLKQNEQDVLLVRYASEGVNNELFGEHFSVTIEKESKEILGFTNMSQKYVLSETNQLLSKAETAKIAKRFLDQFAPGYFETLNNLWIDQHDETIQLEGYEMKVSGMKYKCYRPITDDYAWLIIGGDGEVITFERGIIWIEGRVTEKWLHDSYLNEML